MLPSYMKIVNDMKEKATKKDFIFVAVIFGIFLFSLFVAATIPQANPIIQSVPQALCLG